MNEKMMLEIAKKEIKPISALHSFIILTIFIHHGVSKHKYNYKAYANQTNANYICIQSVWVSNEDTHINDEY